MRTRQDTHLENDNESQLKDEFSSQDEILNS